MKFLSLVLCVVMLHITTASRGLPQPHHLHKRQSSSFDACSIAVNRNLCTSGYQQGYATLLAKCGQRESAMSIAQSCESSSSGTLCGVTDVFDLSANINTTCSSGFPTTCSSDCQALLTSTRAELGCCINYLNNTNFGDVSGFDNSLWSLCDVELVTEECAPGPIELPDTTSIDPICFTFFDHLYSEVLCRTQYLESLRDTYIESCGFDPTSTFETCVIDEEGRYCEVEQAMQDTNSPLFTAASTNCADTSICDPLCIETLSSITSCCFITEYNGTSADTMYDWLSYEFWAQCDLTSPGLCESRFNDEPVDGVTDPDEGGSGATNLHAPGIATMLAVALMVFPQ